MNIGIIVGSHRLESQSTKVGRYIDGVLKSEGHQTEFLDLRGNPLPLWDESRWTKEDTSLNTLWAPVSKTLHAMDGFVVISPEWHGMVPAGLKNFFLLCEGQELSHKAALIVTVSSGRGGAYPVNELRTSSYKNTRIAYIPEQVIVRQVEEVLNESKPTSTDDEYIRDRISYACRLLGAYTSALCVVRASGVIDHERYQNGM